MEEKFDIGDVSRYDIEQLQENMAWKLLVQEVDERIRLTNELLLTAPLDDIWEMDENGNSILSRVGVKSLQGEIRGLSFVQFLITSFKEELKQMKEDANGEQ